MAKLDAVLFDIDDTLFSTTVFARRARRAAVEAMVAAGLDLDPDLVEAELNEVIAEFSSNYGNHFDQLLKRLRPAALERYNSALIVAAGVAAYHDEKFRTLAPFADVVPLLTGLRDAGLTRGVITHGWTAKQAEKLVRLGLAPHFDPKAIFISSQIGISKPNPKLYSTALRSMWLEPSEVLYIGDNLAHDVVPPNSLGMVTAWSRRSAREGQDESIQPDYIVDDFRELATILREQHELPLEEF